MILSGLLLLMVLIVLPFVYHGNMSSIDAYKATELSLSVARENGVDIENATIQHKIIDCNQWLAKNNIGMKQYQTRLWI